MYQIAKVMVVTALQFAQAHKIRNHCLKDSQRCYIISYLLKYYDFS